MYTTHTRPYHDLIRDWHSKSLQGLPRSAADSSSYINNNNNNNNNNISPADASLSIINDFSTFPPFVDPSEEQEFCMDPIKALAIPRSQYHNIKELTLCRKGITKLHTNVQLLENLDTLILRHNRIRQIDFLLPNKKTKSLASNIHSEISTGGEEEENNNNNNNNNRENTVISNPYCNIKGCRLLRRLFASHNCIQTLDGDLRKLRHLEVLLLAHNRLSNLNAVSSQLKPLRRLREVDLRGNPICDEVGYRLFLIYEHPHIEILDRRVVQSEERKAAAEKFNISISNNNNNNNNNNNTLSSSFIPVTGCMNVLERKVRSSSTSSSSREYHQQNNQQEQPRGIDKREIADMEIDFNKSTAKQVKFSSNQNQEQQQQNSYEASNNNNFIKSINGKSKKIVAFLSTISTPTSTILSNNNNNINTENAKAPHGGYFKPSNCEILLNKKVRRIEKKEMKRKQEEILIKEKAEREVQESYQAFHAAWALSRRGMPLSTEKCELIIKAMEAAQSASLINNGLTDISLNNTINNNNSQHRNSLRRRSIGNKQQINELNLNAANATRNNLNIGIDLEQLELPQLSSCVIGKSDHSILYDAILNRSSIIEARVGKNIICLPETHRLQRIHNILHKTSELLEHSVPPVEAMEIKLKQGNLIREIQEQKDALIPEPWEHIITKGLTATLTLTEQIEYLHIMAISFFLSNEFSALKGQFISSSIEGIIIPETQQRSKKPAKKEKRQASETGRLLSRTSLSNPNSVSASSLPITSSALLQKLPTVLTSTNIEIGPPERTTFIKIMNMLDGESGVWNLNIDNLTEAFRAEYQTKALANVIIDEETINTNNNINNSNNINSLKGDDRYGSPLNRRGRRSITKGRIKGETGGKGRKSTTVRNNENKIISQTVSSSSAINTGGGIGNFTTVTNSQSTATVMAMKSINLMLNSVILDMMRYLPFVQNRLEFFRNKSIITASKGEGGATGEDAREWFAKAQLASEHFDKLQKGLQNCGMSLEEAKVRLVPLESIAMNHVQEVGAYFRKRV